MAIQHRGSGSARSRRDRLAKSDGQALSDLVAVYKTLGGLVVRVSAGRESQSEGLVYRQRLIERWATAIRRRPKTGGDNPDLAEERRWR